MLSTIYDLRLTEAVNYEIKLAWKYFRARRKSLARLTAIVAVVGIASGVAALILAQAVSRGFAEEMREKILANTAHIAVFRIDGAPIDDWERLKTDLEKTENVVSVEPTIYESALIIGATSTVYCVIRTGSEFNSEKSEIGEQTKSASRKSQVATLKIGANLAEKTGLKPNDEAEIILPRENDAPKNLRVRVGEIFRTGIFDYDSTWIFLAPEDFAELSEKSVFVPTVLNVSLKDIYSANETAEKISRNLGENFKVLDWQTANQPLFAALGLERKVSFIIISLIIFIAVLNITTTLALLVNERRLDIAILRTCGAQTRSLLKIFLLEGFLLGLIGTFFGVIVGYLLCLAGNYFKLINLPSEIYSISYVPLRPQFSDVFLIMFVALALSLTATIYPAWRASRIKPSENLRNQQ